MLKNNIKQDIQSLCKQENIKQTSIANEMGVSKQYISKLLNGKQKIFSSAFITICDILGYDIEIVYHKKESDKERTS